MNKGFSPYYNMPMPGTHKTRDQITGTRGATD